MLTFTHHETLCYALTFTGEDVTKCNHRVTLIMHVLFNIEQYIKHFESVYCNQTTIQKLSKKISLIFFFFFAVISLCFSDAD